MNTNDIMELKNSIIDAVNNKSTNFKNMLIDYCLLFKNQKVSSFDIFLKIFNEHGKFIYWIICQILNYSKDYSIELEKDDYLKDLFIVYNLDKNLLDYKNAISILKYDFPKILLVFVMVSNKIREKQYIEDKYILAPFTLENSYKYYDLSSISKEETRDIMNLLKELGDFSILEHNLHGIEYLEKEKFLKEISNVPYKNYLNWNHNLPKPMSIEEHVVVELLSVKYINDKDKNILQECMNFGRPWPNIKEWNRDMISSANHYFQNENIECISNLIDIILFNGTPCAKTESVIIAVIKDFFDKSDILVYPIINFAYKNKNVFSKNIQKQMVTLSISGTEEIFDINTIERFKEAGIILHNRPLNILKEKNRRILEVAKTTTNEMDFIESLRPEFCDEINYEDVKTLSQQFEIFANNSCEPKIYISYMLVLDRLKQLKSVDANWISKEIVKVVYIWQRVGYNKTLSSMERYNYNGPSLSQEKADLIFKSYFKNQKMPFFTSLIFSDEIVSKRLIDISNGAFQYFSKVIIISKDFPHYKSANDPIKYDINLIDEADDFEKIMYKYFEGIIDKIGHRFTNHYSSLFFLREYIERYKYYVMPLYIYKLKRKRIYEYIKQKRPNGSYSSYASNPSYSDLTQLFPLLEKEILYIGAKYGISPIDISEGENFGRPTSPAQTLLKLIRLVYDNTRTMVFASDFIAIYILMYYNKNMNIRNSVVHGNNYPYSPEIIDSYYTITLLCLADLIKRNEEIEDKKHI